MRGMAHRRKWSTVDFRRGRDMTLLVLLPGMDGTGTLFAPFQHACGHEFTAMTIAYPADSALGYRELEQYVIARLPKDDAYVVVAESFSGPLGIALAAARPPGMLGLVLCCTFARNPRPLLSLFAPLLPLLPLKFIVGNMHFLANRWLFGRHGSKELDASLRLALRGLPAAVLRARLQAVARVDYSRLLTQVMLPILSLRASEDRIVPASAGAAIARSNALVKVITLPGPHMLLQALPEAAVDALAAFIQPR
jgi:pimeloyl-ACP methyl ester carboxylesterase